MRAAKCLWKDCDHTINQENYIGRPRIFCSDTCKSRHVRLERKKADLAFHKSMDEEFASYKSAECKCCGKDFVTVRKDQVFCSKECKTEYHNNKRKATVIPEPKKFVNICRYSGERFETDTETAKFANKNCSNMFRKQHRLPELVTFDETFEGMDFASETELINEIFIDCDFEAVFFHKKDLTRARFIRCRFTDCDFTWSNFQAVDLVECEFYGKNNFDNAKTALTKFPTRYSEALIIDKTIIKLGMKLHELRSNITKKCKNKFIETVFQGN